LTNEVEVGTVYPAGDWALNDHAFPDEPGVDLSPVWTEQQGAEAGLDSLKDSITYDAWERVLAWVQTKVGTGVVARDMCVVEVGRTAPVVAGRSREAHQEQYARHADL
jgi:hypothetical protein